MRIGIVVGRADELDEAAAWTTAARRVGDHVGWFVMADAVVALAADLALQHRLLEADIEIWVCATRAHQAGLGPDAFADGVVRGSQDDHAALAARADRWLAWT